MKINIVNLEINAKRISRTIIIMIAFFTVLLVSGGIAARVASTSTEFKIGKDQFKSVVGIVGEREVSSFKINANKKSYLYTGISDVKEDLLEYIKYLVEEEGFIIIQSSDLFIAQGGICILVKDSTESGKIIKLEIDFSLNEYRISISKTSRAN